MLEKSVLVDENRFTSRVIRNLVNLRRRLNVKALQEVITESLSSEDQKVAKTKSMLLEHLSKLKEQEPSPMEVDTKTPSNTTTPPTNANASSTNQNKKRLDLPETEVYLHLLVVIHLLDKKQHQQVCFCPFTPIRSQTKKNVIYQKKKGNRLFNSIGGPHFYVFKKDVESTLSKSIFLLCT